MPVSAFSDPSVVQKDSDPYRAAVAILAGASFLGAWAALVAGADLGNPVVLDAGVTLGLSAGILLGVMTAQTARTRSVKTDNENTQLDKGEDKGEDKSKVSPRFQLTFKKVSESELSLKTALSWLSRSSLQRYGRTIRVFTVTLGSLAVVTLLLSTFPETRPSPVLAAIVGALCLGAAALAAIAARYFNRIETMRFPEAADLCRGARVVAWILIATALSMALAAAGLNGIVRILHFAVLAINALVCYGLFSKREGSTKEGHEVFPLDFAVLFVLGSRANLFGSILDAGERQLGIDLRSTWALAVVRRNLEPLLFGLVLLGWLSTSLTVVDVQEEGLQERLGVPVRGSALQPGLHLHWPWPVDRVVRIPAKRIGTEQIGHEGQEAAGPEDVLWAVEHAPNEYTLLLGNGRDLITIDATVQYRVVDARAWRYNCQNPAEALRAIAYRAVMKSTVNRTLSEALSENVSVLTRQMRDSVQRDADTVGLGVEVLAFTVGGMHPPVPVAADYEAVVSAELGKGTAVVNAEAYRNELVPVTEASVLSGNNGARAEAENARALAAGQAWSFRILESEYRTAPEEFRFRRRLEGLEENLSGRRFVVVDARYLRDGGLLWLTQ